ncbi:stress-responsive transcription factor hsf1 [Rhizophlyctis rosea]|nr:stress-responsive transcription factor hsf1 [Rhizophlyctis rosea]
MSNLPPSNVLGRKPPTRKRSAPSTPPIFSPSELSTTSIGSPLPTPSTLGTTIPLSYVPLTSMPSPPSFATTESQSTVARYIGSLPQSLLPPATPAPSQAKPLPKSKLSATAAKNVPAFLNKLYNMVCDTSTDELIHWGEDGTTFIVQRHEDFARDVLPRFFKHNNFASFVRQLNMYGFHKVPHLQQGVLHSDGEPEIWEFQNDNFQRGQPDLLVLVSRKKGRDQLDEKETGVVDLNNLIQEIAAIKRHQLTISADLKNIQRDNQVLWTESMAIRDRYQRQQDTIDKILRFLASVFSNKKKPLMNKRRKLLLGQKLPVGEEMSSEVEDEDDDEDIVVPVNPDIVQQRIVDLMSPPPDVSPAALVHEGGSQPTSSLSHYTEPSYFDRQLLHTTNNLTHTAQRADEVHDNIDLLQDHLQSISDLVGINGDVTMEDLDDIDMRDLLDQGPMEGSEEDRETLLALMAHHNTPSPPSTTSTSGYVAPLQGGLGIPTSSPSIAPASKIVPAVQPVGVPAASPASKASGTLPPQTPPTPVGTTPRSSSSAAKAGKSSASKTSKGKTTPSPVLRHTPSPASTIQLLPTPPLAPAQLSTTLSAAGTPVLATSTVPIQPLAHQLVTSTGQPIQLLPLTHPLLQGTYPIITPATPLATTTATSFATSAPASTPLVPVPTYILPNSLSTATLPSLPVASPPSASAVSPAVGGDHPFGLEGVNGELLSGGYPDDLERFLAFPEGEYDFLSGGGGGVGAEGEGSG